MLSCYLIGEDHLVVQCAEVLAAQGYQILGIVSPFLPAQAWAAQHKVSCFAGLAEAQPVLLQVEFDYLFSVVNGHILPAALLRRPKKLAINYHDAPLPKYAGVHATAWAILQGERAHGVSWHVMNARADAGDILRQAEVAITPDDTTLTLNLKCHQAALAEFVELAQALKAGDYVRTPQDLALRTYYGLHQKPPSGGWINWRTAASAIVRLCRALHFGNYANRLAVPKCRFGCHVFIVGELRQLDLKSTKRPGTVMAITAQGIQVATQTEDVLLARIFTVDGERCDIENYCRQLGLAVGAVLESPTEKLGEALKCLTEHFSQHERAWEKSLKNFPATALPFLPNYCPPSNRPFVSVAELAISAGIAAQLEKNFPGHSLPNVLLALWMVYLFRVNNHASVGARLQGGDAAEKPSKQLLPFIANGLPLWLELKPTLDFSQALECVVGQIALVTRRGPYLKDLCYRYPELRDLPKIPLAIVIGNEVNNLVNAVSLVVFAIAKNSRSASLWAKEELLATAGLKRVLKNAVSHLSVMLKEIACSPQQAIASLPLLAKTEFTKIAIAWNQTHSPYPRDKTVHQLFEEQAMRTPAQVALASVAGQLTYHELNARANQLAHYLRKRQVVTETPVGIFAERSIEMIVGILAILKAGGAYVPLDPSQPDLRLQHMIADCQVKNFLLMSAQKNRLAKIASGDCQFIVLGQAGKAIAKESTANLTPHSSANNLIYIMYTSGSTGRPKGIAIMHQGVARLVKATNYIKLGKRDCVAHIANPAFDAATFEIWGALLNGARLALIPDEVIYSLDLFKKHLKDYRVNTLWLTAALFNQAIEILPSLTDGLKNLLLGGEALSPRHIRKLLVRKNRPKKIINGYGPTENTTFTACYEIKKLASSAQSVPIGKPIANTQVYLLDKNAQLLPIGTVGELYVGGDGLARGYVNLPELTASKFLTKIINGKPARLYKTGDLARWLPNGDLEFVGRADDQVKIRGFRVELKEIERQLEECPGVKQAVVLVDEGESPQKKLIAFLLSDRKRLDIDEVRLSLKTVLPEYMLPASFCQIEKIPLTLNGKIDQKQLLGFYKEQTAAYKSASVDVMSLPEVQRILMQIWQETFKRFLSVEDDFFELGGNSILAMLIIARSWQKSIRFSIKDIFKYRTVARLAAKFNKICEQKNGKTNFIAGSFKKVFFCLDIQ